MVWPAKARPWVLCWGSVDSTAETHLLGVRRKYCLHLRWGVMVTKSTGTAEVNSAVTFPDWKRFMSWTDPGICSKSLSRSFWTEHADRPTSGKSWRRYQRADREVGKQKLWEWSWTKRARNHPLSSPELQQYEKTRQSIFLTYLATWSRNIKHCITRLLYLERYFRSTVYWTRVSWARLGGRLLVDSYRDSKLLSIGRTTHKDSTCELCN